MDQTLLKFIKVLRHADIPVSSADTLVAMQAVALLGYENRPQLKNVLGITLAKSLDDKETLNYCFDHFFQQPGKHAAQSEDEKSAAAQMPDDKSPSPTPDTDKSNDLQAAPEWDVDALINDASSLENNVSPMAQLLLSDNAMEQQLQIQQAGEAVGLSEIRSFTQKGQYSRRMLMSMGLAPLQEEIHSLEQSDLPEDRHLAHLLKERLSDTRGQVRDYVENQFMLYAGREGSHLQQETLRKLSLNRLEQHHYDDMQKLVRLLAKRLVKKHSRRKRKNTRGRLDVSATLRNNFAYDGTLIDIRWRSKRKKLPTVYAICDISGSVSRYSKFFLLFIYSLQEVLPQIRSFVFSSRIVEVSEMFERYPAAVAVEEANRRWGQAGTDYGRAWLGFEEAAMCDLRQDSLVIVLGDARNNGADPRLDIVRQIYQRCGRLVWLNPESKNSWQTGDSEMLRYRSVCHQAAECRTLEQLTNIIDKLLVYR